MLLLPACEAAVAPKGAEGGLKAAVTGKGLPRLLHGRGDSFKRLTRLAAAERTKARCSSDPA